MEAFKETISKHGLELNRAQTTTLQINVGFLCNQTCRHCHLNAGPDRKENMRSDTINEVINYARRGHFETVDITGGAPELNPNLAHLIDAVAPLTKKIMLRSNLSALFSNGKEALMGLLKEHHVVIVASFPSLNESQAESQRG